MENTLGLSIKIMVIINSKYCRF